MTVREIKVNYYTVWTDWSKISLNIHAEGQSLCIDLVISYIQANVTCH